MLELQFWLPARRETLTRADQPSLCTAIKYQMESPKHILFNRSEHHSQDTNERVAMLTQQATYRLATRATVALRDGI